MPTLALKIPQHKQNSSRLSYYNPLENIYKGGLDEAWEQEERWADDETQEHLYLLDLLLLLFLPYKRKRLKADMEETVTMQRQARKALTIPPPTRVQNFPYRLHIFIHCSSCCPNWPSSAACTAAATAARVRYDIPWRRRSCMRWAPNCLNQMPMQVSCEQDQAI